MTWNMLGSLLANWLPTARLITQTNKQLDVFRRGAPFRVVPVDRISSDIHGQNGMDQTWSQNDTIYTKTEQHLWCFAGSVN